MQVAVVVQAGQVVALGDLLGLAAVEHVLDRDRDVAGEDLQQVAVLAGCSRGRCVRLISSRTPQTSCSMRIGTAISEWVWYRVCSSIRR